MKTPLDDALRSFADQDRVRLHMPGHKGRGFAGARPVSYTHLTLPTKLEV